MGHWRGEYKRLRPPVAPSPCSILIPLDLSKRGPLGCRVPARAPTSEACVDSQPEHDRGVQVLEL
jgi:hypothetical protein